MSLRKTTSRFRSDRLSGLGSAIFSEVAGWKREAKQAGLDIIDLGIGSPDQPPSGRVRQALCDAAARGDIYGYAGTEGTLPFRRKVAEWYQYRFGVDLDPESEIISLMGSQDGLSHLALAVTNPGDVALIPDPGYPIYAAAPVLAGAIPYPVPLKAEHQYLPQLEAIPQEVIRKSRYMLFNYPSNPLSAVADLDFFERAVWFARRHDLLLVHDLAYSEMAFDGFRPPSVLEVPGAKEVAVEFNSLSKSFNMAGCRLAYMVGNAEVVGALGELKSNIDYGVFHAVQEAGIAAMQEHIEHGGTVADLYQRRRDVFVEAIRSYGWEIPKPKATMFIWAPIPSGWTSRQISREMLRQTGVAVIPGDAFGQMGEGYVRIALVQEEVRLLEAARRIGEFMKSLKASDA
jgi:LL-diaminopimelate aminotransferase